MKNITIINQPYIYENAFKNDDGDVVNYSQLRVDVKIGDTIKPLSYKLKGFEIEYIKSLISADNAFNESDISND